MGMQRPAAFNRASKLSLSLLGLKNAPCCNSASFQASSKEQRPPSPCRRLLSLLPWFSQGRFMHCSALPQAPCVDPRDAQAEDKHRGTENLQLEWK